MNIRIEDMEVAEVDPVSWKIRVGPLHSPLTKSLQYNAKMLSPVPLSSDGSGLFAVPKQGDLCTVLIRGTEAFILGFRPAGNFFTTGYGGARNKVGLEEGDVSLISRIGLIFKSSIRGSFHFIADTWSRLMISRSNKEIRGWFSNLRWRQKGGRVEWTESQYISVKTDKFEDDINDDSREQDPALPLPTSTLNPEPIYANKEINKFGYANAMVSRELRGGAEEAGELPNRIHKKEEMLDNGTEVVETISGPNGTIKITMLQSNDKYRLEFLRAEGPPIPYCVLRIGEDSVILAHSGEIRLGGQGEEQQLVTKKFVEEIFENHKHMGNNGAPTSTPLNNWQITNPVLRDDNNHFTKDTVAE